MIKIAEHSETHIKDEAHGLIEEDFCYLRDLDSTSKTVPFVFANNGHCCTEGEGKFGNNTFLEVPKVKVPFFPHTRTTSSLFVVILSRNVILRACFL